MDVFKRYGLVIYDVTFIFCLAILCATLLTIPIYRVLLWLFPLGEVVHLTTAETMTTYLELVRFILIPFYPFKMTFLSSSSAAVSHFYEVKIIFQIVLGLFILLLASYPKIRKKSNAWEDLMGSIRLLTYLKYGLIMVVGLVGLFFDQFFILFHQILFRNDNWLFNPQTDPVIYILPPELFLIAFLIGFALLLLVLQYRISMYRCELSNE